MNKRRILFIAGTILILLCISACMMIIGRGHTVYMDCKTVEYEGETYEPAYKTVVFVDGEQVAKLYDGERGSAICIGQTFEMTLEITQDKGGTETTSTHTIKLPYGMDGIVINLPTYLAGLPEEVYLSEFVSKVVETTDDDEVPSVDEFEMGDI